jgi:hypothetical protein
MTNRDYNLNDDLSDLIGGDDSVVQPARQLPVDEGFARIRETTPEFVEQCPKCRGRGRFISYAGRDCGRCFTCKGLGTKSFKSSPQARATARERTAQQPARRWEAFIAAQPAAAGWMMDKADRFEFARSMREAVEKYGDLTERQMQAVERCMARDVERDAARAEQRAQLQSRSEGVDASKIVAAFEQAKAKGLKYIQMQFKGLRMSRAPDSGKNPGAIYVKTHEAQYLGKIMNGVFSPSRECTAGQQAAIVVIAADPEAAAKVYGLETGTCSCCGRELTNKLSIELGIGPICREKFF